MHHTLFNSFANCFPIVVWYHSLQLGIRTAYDFFHVEVVLFLTCLNSVSSVSVTGSSNAIQTVSM